MEFRGFYISWRTALLLSIVTFAWPFFGVIMLILLLSKNIKGYYSKNIKVFLLPLAFIFANFGYSMEIPLSNVDLNFYFKQIEQMKVINLSGILIQDNEFLYTRDLLFYFVSRTADVHILPYIVGFIIYFIVFYVLFDRIQRSSKKFSVFEICALVMISIGIVSPFSIISNTRCVLAYCIVCFATYRDLVQHKKNLITLVLYILPIGLHISTIAILIIRLSQVVVKRVGRLSIIVALFIPAIIDIIHPLANRISGNAIGYLIATAINKAYSYLHWTEGGWANEIQNSIYNRIQRIYGAFFILCIALLLYIAKYCVRGDVRKYKDIFMEPMVSYLYIVAVCSLGCLYITTGAFWRFESIIVLFSCIFFVPLLEMNERIINSSFNMIFISAIAMFIANLIFMWRNLMPLETLTNLFFSNGFQILFGISKFIVNL